jgi:hypothetical protein
MTDRWFTRGVFAVACLALASVFYPLFIGEGFFWGPMASGVFPLRAFALDALAQGELPLWNPYNGAGVPVLAQAEGAFFYPFTWLALVLPQGLAFYVSLMLHLLIAGAGMWVFMGRLHVPAFGQGVSAFAFSLGHYFLARLGDYPLLTTAAWLPWLLWAVFTVLLTGHRRDMRWVALFVALILLAGQGQIAIYNLLLAGMFALFWVLRQTRNGWRRRLVILIAGGMLGFLIASIQLFPVLELWFSSAEAEGLPFAYITQNSYLPEQVFNLLSPNINGTPADGTYHGNGDFRESAVYIGLLPLVGAALAVVGWVRSGLRRVVNEPDYYKIIPFCIVIATLSYVLALGDYTRIYAFLYEHVPGFNALSVPARWHLWTVFALSVLGGIGTQVWQPGPRLFRLTRSAVMGAAGVAIVAGIVLLLVPLPGDNFGATETLLKALAYTAVVGTVTGGVALLQPVPMAGARYQRWALMMIALVAADLSFSAWGLNPTAPLAFYETASEPLTQTATPRTWWLPDAEAALFPANDSRILTHNALKFRESGLPNLNLLSAEGLLNHRGGLQIAAVEDYLALIAGYPEHRSRLLQAAYVDVVRDETREIVPVDIPIGRAWLVESACWHMDSQAVSQAMLDPAWEPERQVHLLGDGGDCDPLSQSADTLGTVTLSEDRGSALHFMVNTPREAFLVVADSHYAGWQAAVDGQTAEIFRANLAFRAVKVPAGAQQVSFTYAPAWLLLGAMCTIIGLVLLLLLFRLAQPASARPESNP